MSKTMRELEDVMNLRADFDTFLSEENWDAARACINEMGDRGQEMEALKMHQELNRAKSYICTKVDCGEEHGRYCKDFNGVGKSAWEIEGDMTEDRLRADETYD